MSFLDGCYISYVNLDVRGDRRIKMRDELLRIGISAARMKGIPVDELGEVYKDTMPNMWNGTRGAIGCFISQRKIICEASWHQKNAFVLEDDVVFCDDFLERVRYIEKFLSTHEWDILFCGGTFHSDIPQWHNKNHPNLKGCECDLNKDFEFTDDERIVRTYGCWGTYAYIVNKNSISKVLKLLDKHLHETIGIDWSFIRVQPQLKCYAFMPGCVKQYDSESNIGSGMTYFSHFERLGGHWFQNKIGDYTPEQFREDISGRTTTIKYRHEIIKLIRYYELPEIFAEVGVAAGDFSIEMLSWNIEKLYLIDYWEHQPNVRGDSSETTEWHSYNYDKVIERTEQYKDKVEILKGYSTDMAKHIPDNSLGFAYVDANHAYEYVKADIETYYPKLLVGGIMCFHDYYDCEAYGVIRAVQEFADANNLEIKIIPESSPENTGAYFIKK